MWVSRARPKHTTVEPHSPGRCGSGFDRVHRRRVSLREATGSVPAHVVENSADEYLRAAYTNSLELMWVVRKHTYMGN